jgi:hypothetical protein
MFRGADCYLLMIADSHDDGFGNVDVLRIAVRQWPEAKLLERARTIVGLPESPTDRDLVELRDNGVTTLVEIDHNVYLPRGITTAGTSLTATARADRLLHWLQSRPLHDLLEPSRQGAHTVDLQRLRVAAHRGRLWLRLDPSRRCGCRKPGRGSCGGLVLVDEALAPGEPDHVRCR